MQAIILAGGKGTRLKPFTNILPKPLMPIGDKSILEIIIEQLSQLGISDIYISCGYLSHLIKAIFEDGKKFGVNIKYSVENRPLGTAGPLSLILENLEDNFIVLNGDILTTLNFKNLYNTHKSRNSDATICIKKREIKVDFGVIETEKEKFINYNEKPLYSFNVSMGINVFNKNAIKSFIKADTYLDIPDLITAMHEKKMNVSCFFENCEWLDIGRIDDYELAVKAFEKKRKIYLKEI